MKITVKEKHTQLRFYDVNWGIVFEYQSKYYMKTDENTAVNLNTGVILSFCDDDTVLPVTAELIITKE